MKEDVSNIVIPVAILALIFLAFRKPRLKGDIVIEAYNLPNGAETITVKPGGVIYDNDGKVVEVLEGYQKFEVTSKTIDGNYKIKYWLQLNNFIPALVLKSDIA